MKKTVTAIFYFIVGLVIFSAESVKIGFITGADEREYTAREIKYAEETAKKLNITLLKSSVPAGKTFEAAIENLSAEGAEGVIVSVAEPKTGAAVSAAAKANFVKLISIDKRLLNQTGEIIPDIVFIGTSYKRIAKIAGQNAIAEMAKRKIAPGDAAAIIVSDTENPDSKEYSKSAVEYLLEHEIANERIFEIKKTQDSKIALGEIEKAMKNKAHAAYIILSYSDENVIELIELMKENGKKNIIGIGAGGSKEAFEKLGENDEMFLGTVFISGKIEGIMSVKLMSEWLRTKEPPDTEILGDGTFIDKNNYKNIFGLISE